MAKPTKAALKKRVNTISELLLRGVSRGQIWQYVAEKTDWKISERTMDRYIADATEAIKKSAVIDLDFEVGRAIERREFLYQKGMTTQDYKFALSVEKDRGELIGLYAPKTTDITSDGDKLEIIVKYADSDSNDT